MNYYTSKPCNHTICYGADGCVIYAGRPAQPGWTCCSSSIGPACQHRTDPKGWTREMYLAGMRPEAVAGQRWAQGVGQTTR